MLDRAGLLKDNEVGVTGEFIDTAPFAFLKPIQVMANHDLPLLFYTQPSSRILFSLSLELVVNCVTPGYIATEMVESVPEKVKDRILAMIPMKRMGTAAEIARVIHFLAADASGYITGQVWGVNGGMDM